jgi:hypothetical protein
VDTVTSAFEFSAAAGAVRDDIRGCFKIRPDYRDYLADMLFEAAQLRTERDAMSQAYEAMPQHRDTLALQVAILTNERDDARARTS